MNILARHCLLIGICALISAGCDRNPSVDSAKKKEIEHQQKSLSAEEAIRIAKEDAAKRGVQLENYKSPKANHRDNGWYVFFEGIAPTPGNHFDIWIDEETRETRFIPGI